VLGALRPSLLRLVWESSLPCSEGQAAPMCRSEAAEEASQANEVVSPATSDAAAAAPRLPRAIFVVQEASLSDAQALSKLFQQDYLEWHRGLHEEVPAGAAGQAEWEAALGAVDFEEVLSPPASEPAGKAGKKKKAGKGRPAATGAERTVRLLKCTERKTSGRSLLVGYVLYELREKGPRTARQKYCELVNIVVQSSSRGHGAGRVLFEGLRADLAASAPEFALDLRLYVAERNLAPTAWYRRMGFQDSGWQQEEIGGDKVCFKRMAFKAPPSK